jgi:type II secretory ATPase GspE/PulE/Tfp pilus assembly ATPase PilB-like protein
MYPQLPGNGTHTDDVLKTVMSLHALGVDTTNISQCITTVCADLLHVTFEPLPSQTTVRQINLEANIFLQNAGSTDNAERKQYYTAL